MFKKNGERHPYLWAFYKKYIEYPIIPFEPLKIRKIRIKYQQRNSFKAVPLAWFISRRISIYLSIIFVRLNIHPDWITFLMIPASLIASIFFFLEFRGSILAGYILLHLWFVLDCTDGEVARMTANCSRYGKTYDYLIHIISH